MADIPREVVGKVADRLNESRGMGSGYSHALAEEVLAIAEEVWPHNPPVRDVASTTAASTSLASQSSAPPWRRFGFGPAVVKS